MSCGNAWHSLPINAHPQTLSITVYHSSDSKIQGANVGPTWGRQGPPWVARTRVGPTLVTQTLLSVSEFGCLLPTTKFHGLILKLFENPIFNLLFLIKDPWRKKREKKIRILLPQLFGQYCCAHSSQISERSDKNEGDFLFEKGLTGKHTERRLGIG